MKTPRILLLILMILFFTRNLNYAQNTAEQTYFKGVEYGAQGKIEKAKPRLQKAWKIDPFFEAAKASLDLAQDAINQKIKLTTATHIFKGIFYCVKGQWDNAVAEFNIAIEQNSKYAYTYTCRGNSFALKGQYDKAISDCNKAIEKNPIFVLGYQNRAIAYFHKKQYDECISDCNKVIEMNPVSARAYQNRALTYFVRGDYNKGWKDFIKLQSLGCQMHPEFIKALREASRKEKKISIIHGLSLF